MVVSSSEQSTSGMTLDQALRTSRQTRALSLPQAVAAVRQCLPVWREERGWGILLFLFSVVMSKGLPQVRNFHLRG